LKTVEDNQQLKHKGMIDIITQLPRIGAHLPIGKGLMATADDAVSKELEAIQIFIRNPRGRGARKLTDQEVDYFNQTMADNDISPVVVHIPYVCNPAAARDDLYNYAYEVITGDIERARLIKADYIVLHPGSFTDTSLDEGIDRVSALMNRILDGYEGPTLLLETMSGQGTEIGKNFQELNQILQNITNKNNIGICFDTCHTFAAGYNCADPEGVEKICQEAEAIIGREKIRLIHANDSLKELGEHRDRHTHIGEGFIGITGFENLMAHDFFRQIPFILETPMEGIEKDIKLLKAARNKLAKLGRV
jgi:deoxyribonuclease-4